MKDKTKVRGRQRRQRRLLEESGLSQVHLNAAGIDIGASEHWVAVPEGRDEQHVRSFPSFTHALQEIGQWLRRCKVETVAMESTGVYWIPLYEQLQAQGFKVLLVNARHVKNVPGRKDDWLDCQWLQKLHTFGLLQASFRPDEHITTLRSYVRHRDSLITAAGDWVRRMQKAMTQMNIQLHNVISDITGKTGMAIIRDIVAGERNPQRLAMHRQPGIHSSAEKIVASLTANYRDEHLFALKQALEAYDFYQTQIRACDSEIQRTLDVIEAQQKRPQASLPAARTKFSKQGNVISFDLRPALAALTGGVDITQLPGITPYNGLKLLSEIGTDMTRFKTEKHFTSWLTLAPHVKASGGKVLSSRTKPSANRAALIFRMAAFSLNRTNTALGAFYRRLAARVGKAKAITATARKLATLFYRLMNGTLQAEQLDAHHYDEMQRERLVRSLRRRAKSLGLTLIEGETGEVLA